MELRHLHYFVAVAEELNFTRAAARLHTAQPSLSQQIRDLEAEVGTPLFERSKRHVALTPAGAVFLNETRLVLAQATRAVELARQAAHRQGSMLRVGFVPAAEVRIFPRVLPMLRAQFPEVELSFHSLTTAEQTEALLAKRIDVGFLRPPLDHPQLASTVVMNEGLVLVLPADHSLAALPAIPPQALQGVPFLRINPDQAGHALDDAIQAWLRQRQLALPVFQEVHNVLTLLSLISMGGGVTLLPEYAEQLTFRNVVTRRLSVPSQAVPLLLAWRKDTAQPMADAFVQLVQESLGWPDRAV